MRVGHKCVVVLVLVLLHPLRCPAADSRPTAISLYSARLTSNHIEHFLTDEELDFKASYLLALAVSHSFGGWRDNLSYGLEAQLVKHFNLQTHWEVNLLGILRWEKFLWDAWLDTSAAFGLGASYATDKPEIEIQNDGETARTLVYLMFELAAVPFKSQPQWEIITRIHHRSNAFGLVAEDGGSNALALGLRYRF